MKCVYNVMFAWPLWRKYLSYFLFSSRLPEGAEVTDPPPVMVIGNNNVFEVDSYCEASKIGDNNVLEAKCKYSNEIITTVYCL